MICAVSVWQSLLRTRASRLGQRDNRFATAACKSSNRIPQRARWVKWGRDTEGSRGTSLMYRSCSDCVEVGARGNARVGHLNMSPVLPQKA